MTFTVTLLGTGAAIPTMKRGATAQFVNCHQRHILIDCGEGTQLQMRRFKIKFQKIQLILISHLHGDHILGLPGLIATLQLLGINKPIQIIGPKGIKEFVLFQFKLAGLKQYEAVQFKELQPQETGIIFEDKKITVSTFPLKHRIVTHGYRIDEKPLKRPLDVEAFNKTGVSVSYIEKLKSGEDIVDNNGIKVRSKDVTLDPRTPKSYAFCSDTAYDENIIPHIEQVDVLYHDSTFTERHSDRAKSTLHATAKQAATIAKKANAKRLILGHFSARYDDASTHLREAQEIFKATFAGEDGELFNV